MESIVKTSFIAASAEEKKVIKIEFSRLWNLFEEARFGFTPVFLIVAACLGGFAAAIAVQSNMIMFSLVVFSTGIVEALLISVMPMKYTFWFFVLAIAIDLIVFFTL